MLLQSLHLNNLFVFGKLLPSPYINRFLSADTVVPGYANPQSLNRYSYVLNNPLRYIDPTGHWADDGYVGNHSNHFDCKKYAQYCTNGKKKSDEELQDMAPKPQPKSEGGSIIPVVSPSQCSGPDCPVVTTVLPPAYPSTLTYHFSDSTIVYDLPIYDYSYYPPKIIGFQSMFYTHDDIHFSLPNFLIPSDPITAADTVHTVGGWLLKAGSKNLGKFSELIGPVCPECFAALSVVAGVDSLNSAVTFDGHLETTIYYYTYQSPFETPFDPKKIR